MATNSKSSDTTSNLPYNVSLGDAAAAPRAANETTAPHRKPPHRTQSEQPSIGLALGGGGARGLAHILMLEVFDEMAITPKVIAGTSIGAIFGAAYASGLTAKQIKDHTIEVLSLRLDLLRQVFAARNEPIQKLLKIFQLRSALLNPEKLLDHVMPAQLATNFAELEIPLKIIAADFYTQSEVAITDGAIKHAVAASIALPALFAPVMTDDKALLDGGLVNPLPFDLITNDADIVVAIDVAGAGNQSVEDTPPSAFHTIVSSLQIMQESIVREKLRSRRPDILIEVDVGDFHVLEFHKLDQVLEAARPAKQQLREKLERILSAQTLTTVDRADPVAVTPRRGKTTDAAPKLFGRIQKNRSPVRDSSAPDTGQQRPRLADRILKREK